MDGEGWMGRGGMEGTSMYRDVETADGNESGITAPLTSQMTNGALRTGA